MPVKYARWFVDQNKAYLSNLKSLFTGVSISDLIPPALESTLRWYLVQFPRILGINGTSPNEQIIASAVVAVSLIAAVVTSYFAIIPGLTLIIGVLRLYPAFNNLWTSVMPNNTGSVGVSS